MEKYFDNLTLGQFILTGIKPIKVYVEGRYLILTDTDDIEDPLYGYGMTQSGAMEPFDYRLIDHILIGNKPVTLEMLNKSAEGEEEPEAKGEEEPAEEEAPEEEKPAKEKKKEESMRSSKLTDIMNEADSEQKNLKKKKEEYLKAKLKATKRDLDNMKKGLGESDEYRPVADDTAYSNVYEDDEDEEWDDEELDFDVEDDGEYDYEDDEYDYEDTEYDGEVVDNEYVEDDEFEFDIEDGEQQDVTAVSEPYTIKVGDLVHNTDCGCKHYGSKGFVISVGPDGVRYSVTNSGPFHKLGDIVTKDLANLESI